MEEITNAVGTVYVDNCAETGIITIYDSNHKFMEKWYYDTFEAMAKDAKRNITNNTAKEMYSHWLKMLTNDQVVGPEHIDFVLCLLGVDYTFVSKDKEEFKKHVGISADEELANNELINQVGPYYILIKE